MASSSTNKAIASDKTNNDPQPLRCPRCDSSYTKFCYYNNYSLSQPRHFCKACKRYWTRGGTLRNVPVGGGCRKNKRSKRHSSAAPAAENPRVQPQINSSNNIQSALLYGLPTNPLELNFPFSSFRVSSDATGFDLHPQINDFGLGFSSSNGFKPIQDAITNSTSSPFSTSENNSIFFGSSSFSSTSSTMASLLASTLQHQQKNFTIPSLMPYEDPQMPGNGKEEENRLSWNRNPNLNSNPNPNPVDQINSSDPSHLLWNATSIGGWFDPSTMGSSVPSLI